ncbi:MAG: glycosyltransferase [Pseudomonadota bacterium]
MTIRVAFGSVPKDGGTFTFYRNMRPALLRRGIDLRCVSVGKDQAYITEPDFLDDGCVHLAQHTSDLKTQAQAFADWVGGEDIDIVIGVNSPAILSAIPHLPKGVRVLARCANGFDEGYRLTLVGKERLSKIIALVPRLRTDLVKAYSVDPSDIVLIPNGASPDRFAVAAAKERGAGRSLSLGYLGRLEHRQKGVLYIPEALDLLDSAGVDYRLSIAGKGVHEQELRRRLAARVDDGRVEFVGTLGPDDIPAFLSQTDVFLFPSHFEGCPNSLLEAMMAGAVPVSWRLHGITDFLLEDGQTGFLAETGDVAEMTSIIKRLSEDRAYLCRISEAGAIAARSNFSVARCASAYEELFRAVVAAEAPDQAPLPWKAFAPDTLFRRSRFAHVISPRQKALLKTMRTRLARPSPTPVRDDPDRPQRIVQVINSVRQNRGGAERIALCLHEALLAEGRDAHLLALEDSNTDNLRNAISLGFSSPYDLRAAAALARRLRHLKAGDIVHAHLFPTSAHVTALRSLCGLRARTVFTEHSTFNRRRGKVLGRLVDRRIYARFDRLVAISDGVKEELLTAFPDVRAKIEVIQNGTRLTFDAPPKRNPGSGPVRVVSVGRLTPAKNFPAAIRAFAKVASPSATYEIAGDGSGRSEQEALIQSLGVGDRVRLLGHVEDVPALLESADVFLLPSAWEGFGLAAVEAMNAALPIVASDVPGLRDVVGQDGVVGYLVDPQTPSEITAALNTLISDPDLRRAMGTEGFKRAGRFDQKAFVSKHLRLYDELSRMESHAN